MIKKNPPKEKTKTNHKMWKIFATPITDTGLNYLNIYKVPTKEKTNGQVIQKIAHS